MLERPDEPALLDALARFLLDDLQPTVKDKKLAFRVLIAANISATLATQLRTQTERKGAELQRLRALLGREGGVPELSAALSAKLQAGGLSGDELHRIASSLQQSLKEALAVVSPSFDTSMEIE